MKILYGVCGEGMGHAMRSTVVAAHLQSLGHNLRFVSSGNAHQYLAARWPGRVSNALGLRTVMASNKIQPMSTLIANVAKQTFGSIVHVATFLGLGAYRPDVVISDFDPWAARYARMQGVPLVAVDNVHFMNRCTHPREMVSGDKTAAAIMFPTVNRMVPGARRYLVTTFAAAPIAARDTALHLPILRPAILRAAPSLGAHVIAYFNEQADHARIGDALGGIGLPIRVYGRRVPQPVTVGNVTWKPFSEGEFIQDLSSSQAVIGGAGFTTMTEAIYLGKPMLAVPFAGQFEQILNANYLAHLGFGMRCDTIDRAAVGAFIARLPAYRQNLAGFRHDGNRGLLRAVEEAIR